jgi:ABC-type transport system involved in multi-copper enzyme maturation permease subunit
MFSALVIEREPLHSQDVLPGIINWLQDKGGWAAFGMLLWLAFGYSRWKPADKARIPSWLSTSITILIAVCGLAYLGLAGIKSVQRMRDVPDDPSLWSLASWCLTIGGTAALLAVCLPIFHNLIGWRFRRIWALTRLSFKEAIRSRVLYAFSALLLVVLFMGWFAPYKPEYQVRNYVGVFSWAIPPLLLLAAAIVAAFSIPTDIRKQTIHTIVTKPVERYELFLGRFLGFTGLMTLVLVVMTTVTLLYVLRGIDPAAAEESLKARDPLYGDMTFVDANERPTDKGISVGREWEYRTYISRPMPGVTGLIGVWNFNDLPRPLAGRQRVRCEFTLDIYRTTKGNENRGVSCRFSFETPDFPKGDPQKRRTRVEAYRIAREQKLGKVGANVPEVDAELIRTFGYYEVPAFEVVDFHTQHIDVPGALFDKALEQAGGSSPSVQARLAVISNSQYVGMNKHDLYLRQDDPDAGHDARLFAYNSFKWAVGVWFRLCLLIGLITALSTYFSGVISLIVGLVLYNFGAAREFIESVAKGTNPEGGAFQNMLRLVRREVGTGVIDDSAATRTMQFMDERFRWGLRRFLDLIPDISRYDLTNYLAEGFNISGGQLFLLVGMLVGYVLPWGILAYYLLHWREVANPG